MTVQVTTLIVKLVKRIKVTNKYTNADYICHSFYDQYNLNGKKTEKGILDQY
ncbi:hypothetical protein C0J52_02448 [Blattella germanica]|nr:hypothetical protein C0J52_02448 [Blattella germanica]